MSETQFDHDPNYMRDVLSRNGWATIYLNRIHGWPKDGWYFIFLGQQMNTETTIFTEYDVLTLDQAWEQQMNLWEE